jgi:succinyl-CoA synthetase beta subunit
MRLAEFDGKALLRRHGLAVPRGVLLQTGEQPPPEAALWPGHLLKAQVLHGSRGKTGLVRRLDDWDAFAAMRRIIVAPLDDAHVPLLLEEAVPIAREIFLAVRVDGTGQKLEMLVAPEGGQDVEQTKSLARIPIDAAAATTPESIYPAFEKMFPPDLAARLARYAARLPEIVRQEDLELLEINPLVLSTDGKLIACDAKIVRDDAADFRHDAEAFATSRRLAERSLTALERDARKLGFQLVETDGDIALVTSGAGLGMMMMDLLADHGLRAASFMDNLRGAPDETMAQRLAIARALATRRRVRAIVYYTVQASRPLAERVEALIAWLASEPLPKPLFVGIDAAHAAARAMSVDAAIARLREAGVSAFTDPLELVRATADALARKPS